MGGGTGSGTQNKEPLLTDDLGCGKSREFPLFSSVSCTKYYNFKHIYRVCTNRKWLQSTIRLGEITAPPRPTDWGGRCDCFVCTYMCIKKSAFLRHLDGVYKKGFNNINSFISYASDWCQSVSSCLAPWRKIQKVKKKKKKPSLKQATQPVACLLQGSGSGSGFRKGREEGRNEWRGSRTT